MNLKCVADVVKVATHQEIALQPPNAIFVVKQGTQPQPASAQSIKIHLS